MRIYAGLRREDWERWGQFTTFKDGVAELLLRELRPDQRIYCSPLVDPYQPKETKRCSMPEVLEAVIASPPAMLCLQTRGPLILRDLELLRRIPRLRVSFSITTNRDDIRRLYEPHCAPFEERLAVIRALRDAGIEVYATLAPLLPCDPEVLVAAAVEATAYDLVGDPLHIRSVKKAGATTREQAFRIADRHGHGSWLTSDFQRDAIRDIEAEAARWGRRFLTGPEGFALLSK
jgi:DNA repair photolyase